MTDRLYEIAEEAYLSYFDAGADNHIEALKRGLAAALAAMPQPEPVAAQSGGTGMKPTSEMIEAALDKWCGPSLRRDPFREDVEAMLTAALDAMPQP